MADRNWFPRFFIHSCLICLQVIAGVTSITVYMDKYGHCIGEDFSLDGDVYTVLPKGGGMQHETLNCDLTFKARPESGICITFNKFYIKDCRVKLKIFDKASASGYSWRVLRCEDNHPKQMCTGNRYVTIKLEKERLNRNRNYDFEILVQESLSESVLQSFEETDSQGNWNQSVQIGESFTGENVFFVSIGIFVAIIVGVIVLIIVIAVLVICCCCKSRNMGHTYQPTATETTAQRASHVQPTAPPPPSQDMGYPRQVTPLYPTLPMQGCPPYHPPNEEPPPYTPRQDTYPAGMDSKAQLV